MINTPGANYQQLYSVNNEYSYRYDSYIRYHGESLTYHEQSRAL